MQNLIIVLCLILSGLTSTSLAGHYANGSCTRPIFSNIKTPTRIAKRVSRLPSKATYNRSYRTGGSVDHTTFDRNGYD